MFQIKSAAIKMFSYNKSSSVERNVHGLPYPRSTRSYGVFIVRVKSHKYFTIVFCVHNRDIFNDGISEVNGLY